MSNQANELSFEIELQPGEKLSLPSRLINSVGPGRWVITVRKATNGTAVRDHSAFLNGYAPDDEGLYDEYSTG